MAAAIGAAVAFAIGNALQHQAASSIPAERQGLGFIHRLATSRGWLIGSSISLTAWGLHITAMNLGTVAIVQPFLFLGVLLAVPIRAFLDRTAPTVHELIWVSVTLVGVIVFVSAAHHTKSPLLPRESAAIAITAVGFLIPLAVTTYLSKRPHFPGAGSILALAAGMVFGCTSGLMKYVEHDGNHGLTYLATHWHIWALLFGSLFGTLLNQQAYQRAKVSVVLPSSNAVSIAIAVAFGWAVFHEQPARSAVGSAIQAACLVVMVVGILKVAREEERHPVYP